MLNYRYYCQLDKERIVHLEPDIRIMDYKLSQAVTESYIQPFGLNSREVLETATHGAATRSIDTDGAFIASIHVKKFTKKLREYLIVTLSDESNQIFSAFIIFPSIGQAYRTEKPLDLLRSLASRFGLELTVGEITAKYVLRAKVSIFSLGPNIKVNNNLNGLTRQFIVNVIARQKGLSNIIMHGFAIDTEKYKKWIESNKKNK